jgi:uncharacterized protein (TIGR02217 family)
MFNETRLLDCVSYGSEFGQEFNTRIVTLRSGQERRNINWSMPLGRYNVMYQALSPEDHIKVRAAHMASMGSAIPFRFKDHTDYKAEDEFLTNGTGSAQTVQLIKKYAFGPVELERVIQKPVMGTVTIYENGIEIGSSVDYATGEVTFTATSLSEVTWSGEFDIPVRFESDRLDVDPLANTKNGFLITTDVGLVEVRL